jgi:general secretion pathway protein F
MQVALKVSGPRGPETVVLDAANEADAIRLAGRRGLRVVAIDAPRATAVRRGSEGRFSLTLFSQELLALLDAGLTLVEALATLRMKERGAAGRRLLEGICKSLDEGKRFSETLERYPQVFPDLYVATIRAAERTGSLPEALTRYVAYAMQFDALRKKLVSAAIYPMALLVVGGLVTLFLLGYVVPRFAAVYESTGRDIPWLSLVLLALGRAIHEWWPLVLAIVAGAGAGIATCIASPAVRGAAAAALLRLPLLRGPAFEYRLCRFYRTLGLLLKAGIPLSKALGMSAGLFIGAEAARVDSLRRTVEEGMTFSHALEAHGLATPVALSLVRVGERSGQLADMLDKTARFHDDDLARQVDWIARIAEPALMTIMGVVVGTTVVLLYLPIFDLAASIQ